MHIIIIISINVNVLHLGQGNPNLAYKIGKVDKARKERDLGITLSADLKMSVQCGIAALKANGILGLIKEI